MANFQFNVNTDAAIVLTDKLERLNKYAFPSAVRSTLSDGAFHMKKGEILKSAKKNMKVKNENFFKANTGVVRAKGNVVNQMEAKVGFVNNRGDKANKAVNYGMEANESGDTDRTGMKYYPATRGKRGLVKKTQYFDDSKIDPDKSGNFIRKAFRAKKKNKLMLVQTKKGEALLRVKSIKKLVGRRRQRSANITTELLMMDRTQKAARAKATHFNREAAQSTQKLMEGFYAKNAQYHFDKALK